MPANHIAQRANNFIRLLNWFFSVLMVLLISIIISVLTEWSGIIFGWWAEPDYLHAKKMFTTELNWVLGDFLSNNDKYKDFFIKSHNNIYYYLIQSSGLEYLSNNVSGFILVLVLASIYIIEVVFIRLIVILCAFPAFFVITCAVMVDSLHVRKMRQKTGAIEKGGIYHHSKRWTKPLMIVPIVFLLASPVSIHPTIFIALMSMVPGVMIWLSISTYKKYW